MTSSDRSTSESAADHIEIDRGALSTLLREVTATHFSVWGANAGGVLTAVRIPTTEVAQQISSASRIVENNLDEAMKMIQAASKQFDSSARRWDAQARQSEAKLRAETATGRLNEAKALHNAIRTRIVPVQSVFRRTVQSLNDASLKRRQQEAKRTATDEAVEE